MGLFDFLQEWYENYEERCEQSWEENIQKKYRRERMHELGVKESDLCKNFYGTKDEIERKEEILSRYGWKLKNICGIPERHRFIHRDTDGNYIGRNMPVHKATFVRSAEDAIEMFEKGKY
jgi:hypothetical protein